jgi:hypothetical protein
VLRHCPALRDSRLRLFFEKPTWRNPQGCGYRVRYRLSDGPKIYDQPLHTHIKEFAETKARQRIEEKEREMAGMLDAKPLRDAAQKPLAAHHADFVANLEWPRLRKIWSRPKSPFKMNAVGTLISMRCATPLPVCLARLAFPKARE